MLEFADIRSPLDKLKNKKQASDYTFRNCTLTPVFELCPGAAVLEKIDAGLR